MAWVGIGLAPIPHHAIELLYVVKSQPHSVKRSFAAICYESNRQIYDSFTVYSHPKSFVNFLLPDREFGDGWGGVKNLRLLQELLYDIPKFICAYLLTIHNVLNLI